MTRPSPCSCRNTCGDGDGKILDERRPTHVLWPCWQVPSFRKATYCKSQVEKQAIRFGDCFFQLQEIRVNGMRNQSAHCKGAGAHGFEPGQVRRDPKINEASGRHGGACVEDGRTKARPRVCLSMRSDDKTLELSATARASTKVSSKARHPSA